MQTRLVGGGEWLEVLDPTAAVMDEKGKRIWIYSGGSVVDSVKAGGQVVWVKI